MAQTQPNVIWVLTDQQRAMMLSCNGDPNVHTPNIDALADMGVNFTRAVSGYPLCCPFRGSMLTSRYPHECVPGHEYQMPPEMPTIADVFNENGYHTAYFDKWHLDGFHEREGRAALHTVPPERRGTSSSGWGMRTTTASTTAGSTAGRARRPFAAGCRDTRRTA
ncbi:MAG TPA: sulfatase-like hydrolase/transferase [Candidatus Spyradocola merdavium]|nr:sulfatase-like hydrolase/transferase [Candidatus Spyradocola merdavium]